MRNCDEIRKWMIDEKLTVQAIADALEVSKTLVSRTLTSAKHRKNSRKVLRYAVDKGCPVEFLDLPADMRRAA